MLNKNKCVGCGMCIMACPFGVLVMGKDEHIVFRCDHCIEEGEPGCVTACPTKCLFYAEVEEFIKCDT